jgi:hypothetical protein
MKRLTMVFAIVALVAASFTLTGCHKLGLVKSSPKPAASPSATKTGQ